jgi:hypothetical protein
VVELHFSASPFVSEAGDRPEASVLVRLQAQRGARVTNLRHESVELKEDERRLAALLDGTRSREQIAAACWPGESTATAQGKLVPALSHFARKALLVH